MKKAGRARLHYSPIDGIIIFKDQVKGRTMQLRKAESDSVYETYRSPESGNLELSGS